MGTGRKRRQRDKERIRGRGEQMFRECPFALQWWQSVLEKNILRGSSDSFGDISICESMTTLCLYLILGSVQTAQRTAVWACHAPVCWRYRSLWLCQAKAFGYQDHRPGWEKPRDEGQKALLQSQGLVFYCVVYLTGAKRTFYHSTRGQLELK